MAWSDANAESGSREHGTQTLPLMAPPLQEMKGSTEETKLESGARRGRVEAGQPPVGISMGAGRGALEAHPRGDPQSWLHRQDGKG